MVSKTTCSRNLRQAHKVKILLTGTFRTGKTTALNILKEKLPREAILLPEVARSLLESNPSLEKNPLFQDILFAEQMRLEREATTAPIVICDRGSVDIVSYSRVFNHPLKKEWVEWCHTYDKVFLFDKEEVPFTEEIIKAESQYAPGRDWVEFRKRVESEIFSVLQELSIPYSIITGTPENRAEVIRNEAFRVLREKEGNIIGNKERYRRF